MTHKLPDLDDAGYRHPAYTVGYLHEGLKQIHDHLENKRAVFAEELRMIILDLNARLRARDHDNRNSNDGHPTADV
jgi:hypothetical protein